MISCALAETPDSAIPIATHIMLAIFFMFSSSIVETTQPLQGYRTDFLTPIRAGMQSPFT